MSQHAAQLDFLQEAMELIKNYLNQTLTGNTHVHKFISPEDLLQKINFTFQKEATDKKTLLALCQAVMDAQVHPHHPHFHNQLFGGFSQYSLAGDMLTSAMNGSMYTFEMAPCFLMMEKELFSYLQGRLGWPTIEGIMAPGGSYANFLAIISARYRACPETRTKGVWDCPRMRIMTSEMGHYSLKKHIMAAGLGMESLISVPSDSEGRMLPDQLDLKIRQVKAKGQLVIMVNATWGTTVLGAIDPLVPISKVCKEHGVWLHVDGAFAGSMILSDKLLQQVPGLAGADSLTWDPHKGLTTPLQATVYCQKHVGLMRESNSAQAGYLFHRERGYDSILDTGDITLQCGRHIDVFKLWTLVKGKGLAGLAQDVERMQAAILHAAEYVKAHSDRFELVKEPQTFACCFYCIPEKLRGLPRNADFYKQVGGLAVKAKKLMLERGKVMVGYSEVPGIPNYFWRLINTDPRSKPADMEFVVEHIAQLCEEVA